MRGIRSAAAAAALAIILCGHAARAQEWQDYEEGEPAKAPPEAAQTGSYLALGAFFAGENMDGLGEVDDSGGMSFRGGYRVAERFGAELVFDWVPGFHRVGDPDIDTFFLGANGKYFFPMGRYQPYLSGGLGYFYVSPGSRNYDDGAFRLGGGVEVTLFEHLSLDLEAIYMLAFGERGGADYGQLGASFQYRF